jgi:hypothetical protein
MHGLVFNETKPLGSHQGGEDATLQATTLFDPFEQRCWSTRSFAPPSGLFPDECAVCTSCVMKSKFVIGLENYLIVFRGGGKL